MSKSRTDMEVQRVEARFATLVTGVVGGVAEGKFDAAEGERRLHAGLRDIGLATMGAMFRAAGLGDEGQTVTVALPDGPVVYVRREVEPRPLLSAFGRFVVERYRYVAPTGDCVYPLDARLRLSARDVTPLMQEFIETVSVQDSFGPAVKILGKLVGVQPAIRTMEEIMRCRADGATEYRQRTRAAQASPGEIVVVSADCKGVPMGKAREPGQRKQPLPGERPDKAKMAAVGVVYVTTPVHRDPQAIASVTHRRDGKTRPPQHREPTTGREVFASLIDREDVFDLLRDALDQRRGPGTTIVGVLDGEEWLRCRFQDRFGDIDDVLLLLDFQHVRTHLWSAAFALHGDDEKARDDRMERTSMRLLCGHAGAVISGMRQSATKRCLSESRAKVVRRVAQYLEDRIDMLDYKRALELGTPIGSGAVEGACGHTVGKRMCGVGRHWSVEGAEAVMALRCIAESHLEEDHAKWFRRQELEREYAWYERMESQS